MYRAYIMRASEFGKPEWDNAANIERILALRAEAARLISAQAPERTGGE